MREYRQGNKEKNTQNINCQSRIKEKTLNQAFNQSADAKSMHAQFMKKSRAKDIEKYEKELYLHKLQKEETRRAAKRKLGAVEALISLKKHCGDNSPFSRDDNIMSQEDVEELDRTCGFQPVFNELKAKI